MVQDAVMAFWNVVSVGIDEAAAGLKVEDRCPSASP